MGFILYYQPLSNPSRRREFVKKSHKGQRKGQRQRKSPVTTMVTGFSMAEKEGFEPSIPFWGIHDFQSCALDQTTRLLHSCRTRLLYSTPRRKSRYFCAGNASPEARNTEMCLPRKNVLPCPRPAGNCPIPTGPAGRGKWVRALGKQRNVDSVVGGRARRRLKNH